MKKYKANCIDKTFPESDELHNLEIFGYAENENEFWEETRQELSGTGILILDVEEFKELSDPFIIRVVKFFTGIFKKTPQKSS